MNFFRTTLMLSTLCLLMLVSGCSDLFQKDINENLLQSKKLQVSCDLNVDNFSLIMEENIEESIDCLGKNLHLFIKVVESKRPRYLSRKALESYLKRNRNDIKPEVLRSLKAVFDLNFLVYGDDPDYISADNVDALVKFAKIFNRIASVDFKFFRSKDSITFRNYDSVRTERIKPAALSISNELRKIFNTDRKGEIHELNLVQLIDSFTTENNDASMADVKKLLFGKKIILGGDKNTITHIELAKLIDNFSSYVVLALDGVRYKNIKMDKGEIVEFLLPDLELINTLVFGNSNRENENLFSISDAVEAAKIFVDKDSDINLDDYMDLFKEAKVLLMSGDPKSDMITGGDLKRAFTHGLNVLTTGSFFYTFWETEFVRIVGANNGPILYDFARLHELYDETEKKRVDDFVRIIKNYRFMKGENISAYYTDSYKRNPDAIFEIALYEYVLTLVMNQYGCPNLQLKDKEGKDLCTASATADHAHMEKYVYMTKDHVVNLLNKFRKVLIDANLVLPGREVKTAETITLLGSLFQYQSDENKVFDVNEATEFAISLFTAVDISDQLMPDFIDPTAVAKPNVKPPLVDELSYFSQLVKDNKCQMDEFGRIEPKCFKENFLKGICWNYPDQFPKLFASLGVKVYDKLKLVCKFPEDAPTIEANSAYLERSTIAARTCHVYPGTTEEIYYSKGDAMSIFLAMMHIETTIIRWDVRKANNYMDPSEVMDAYNIYSPALDGFMENLPAPVKIFKKQIYQYLVKYEQVPNPEEFKSVWKFVKFLFHFKKEANANRKTIASILVAIGEQGAKSAFDCKMMRNLPIPEDYDPSAEAINSSMQAPLSMTHDDMELMQDVNSESESKTQKFIQNLWPNFLKIIF